MRAPARWFQSISVASRLAMAIVVVSLVSLSAATFVGLRAGQGLTRDLVHERLLAFANSGSTDVAAHVLSMERVGATLAVSPATRTALEDFRDAFDELRTIPLSEAQQDVEDLLTHYRQRYIEPIEASGSNINLRDVIADDNAAALELQKAYSVPMDDIVDVTQVDDADDGSAWSEVHRRVHPTYRDVAERSELVDVLLVEPRFGYVVYSYAKNADLGTSLEVGPFGGSVVASTAARAAAEPDAGSVLSDFSTYTPNVLTPVAAIAHPVMDGDDLAGVLVLLHSAETITDLLTGGEDWESAGFPPSSENFLIGADGLMRSEPRSFLEDRSAHLEAVEETGAVTARGRQQIAVAGTTVLVERAVDDTVAAAVAGDDDLKERTTTTGVSSFNSAEAVPLDDLDWYVVSEVERNVADGDLDVFAQWLIVGAAVFVVIVAFGAVSWSDRVLRPIRATSERLRAWTGDGRVPEAGGSGVPPVVEVDLEAAEAKPAEDSEDRPRELRELVESFDAMLASLEGQGRELRTARERRFEMLRSLLPEHVAARVESGDLESVEDVDKVTVAVVVVAGLAELVRPGHGSADRALVERVHGELDEIGEQHGLERIKVVGDSYYAACGHSRPYIDHAPRVLAFAADARDAVREIGESAGYPLDVVAGIDTGTVHVGITRASGLVYDVWGPPVSAAHNLSRAGRRGQLLVTDAVRVLLPDTVSSEGVDDLDGAFEVEPASIGGAV